MVFFFFTRDRQKAQLKNVQPLSPSKELLLPFSPGNTRHIFTMTKLNAMVFIVFCFARLTIRRLNATAVDRVVFSRVRAIDGRGTINTPRATSIELPASVNKAKII